MVNTMEVSVTTNIMHQAGNKALVCIWKKTPTFGAFYWICICCAAAPQVGRLLLRIGRLLPKSAGVIHQYSLKCCAALLTNFPELHLCLPELRL